MCLCVRTRVLTRMRTYDGACVCARERVLLRGAHVGTCVCERVCWHAYLHECVCVRAHACALEGKGSGAHVGTRVRVCVYESVCMCVQLWACVCALAGAHVPVCA